MPVNEIHHFTIMTTDLEKTAQFFKDALGFTDGYVPDTDPGFRFTWLYCGDQPTLHIVEREPRADSGTGRIDHVAFNCSDYPDVKARLEAHGATIEEQTLPDVGVHQIFVESLEGVWLELVFDYAEYRASIGDAAAAE